VVRVWGLRTSSCQRPELPWSFKISPARLRRSESESASSPPGGTVEVGAAGSGRGRGHGNCKVTVTVDSDFHSLGRFNSAAGETPGQWEPEPEPAADSEARSLASSETTRSKPDRRDQEERHWRQSRDGTCQ
jgi:hypothetical protein